MDIGGDDTQLRAMVALIEAQAEQLDSLREAVNTMEGRLALRSELDVLVAHEVRTPLTIVLGCLQTMRIMNRADERFETMLDKAAGQAEHLTEVVNEMLTPQGTGGPAVNRTRMVPFRLGDLVDRAVVAVSGKLDTARIEHEYLPDLIVRTSAPRFTAILVNLLENASRYGGTGPITVTVAIFEGLLRVEVADRGAGLGEVDPESLFAAFTQGDRRHAEGRGMGLYLVRMLASSLGGTATIGNRDGGGAVVTIEMPQRRFEDAEIMISPEAEAN